MSNGIQTQVNAQQAVAVAGDWCDGNPRAFVDAGQGALVAGPAGVTVGRFAWRNYQAADNDGAPAVVNNYGTGAPTGFVHRQMQALVTTYLADASMVIPPGFELALVTSAGVFAKNDGATSAQVGMKAYASFTDGKVSFAATGAASTATATGSVAAGAGASFTASITGNVMTVTAVGSGTIQPGGVISGSNVVATTEIVTQLTSTESGGALGGKGTYSVSIPEQTVVSTAITETWGVLTLASALSGTFYPGNPVTGPGGSSDPISAGTYIVRQLTGTTGGIGTYLVNKTQTSSSATVTAANNVETRWAAASAGLVGELVKMTTWPVG